VICRKTEQRCQCSLTRLAQERQQTHLNLPFSFPETDAKVFQDITITQQDQLMADFTAAAITHERASCTQQQS
jgi:hypothetical protein